MTFFCAAPLKTEVLQNALTNEKNKTKHRRIKTPAAKDPTKAATQIHSDVTKIQERRDSVRTGAAPGPAAEFETQ